MPQRRGIGQAELEILNYIHDHHPATVRQVADHVAATKGHTRTTVLNVMTRLVNKGYLTRHRSPVTTAAGSATGSPVTASRALTGTVLRRRPSPQVRPAPRSR